MARIFPFTGYRYDAQRVTLADVVTQPYDKISPEMQERYFAASPYNFISVEKGKALAGDSAESNVYPRAAEKLREWIAEKVLVREGSPAIYRYTQEYTVTGHVARSTREGFIALGQLEDYEAGVVFRHEKTLTAPKADRLELLRHTETQTGQLFMLYDDPRGEAEKLLTQATRGKPATEVRDEYDVLHRLWAVEDAATIARVQLAMADKKLVIADGHHRYETALNYRDECRARSGARDANAPYERAMMTFVNSRSRGLTILPTHRVVRQLENFNWEKFRERVSPYFHWYAYPFANAEERAESYAQWRKDLAARAREGGAIGAYPAKGAFFLFVARRGPALDGLLAELSEAQRRLDVVLLHHVMLEKGLGIRPEEVTSEQHITYEREMDRAIAAVDSGEARLALLLNAVHIGQMMEIALAGEVLPQKSTDFYPKLLSGLVLYRLNG